MDLPTLDDLVRCSGLSRRKVRFLVSERVLERAESRGPDARYPAENLDRAYLVQHYQDQGMTLEEIRSLFDQLGAAGLAALAAQHRAGGPLEAPAPGSVGDYLDEVLGAPAPAAAAPRAAARSVEGRSEAAPQVLSAPSLSPDRTPRPGPWKRSEQTWHRVELTDGLELHYRGPRQPRWLRRLDQLIHHAHDFFSEESN